MLDMKIDLSKYQNRHSAYNKVVRMLWGVIWSCFARITPRWMLNDWRCMLLRLFGAKIGTKCKIYGSTSVWVPQNLEMGNNCWIDGRVKIYNVDKIRLGSNCIVSEGAFLCTASHDISSPVFELVVKPIEIHDCAWICSNAVVLPGVTIGAGAVVAAGAVVVKDVPAWTVVAGNPARFVKRRKIDEDL